MKKLLFLLPLFITFYLSAQSTWNQQGADIDGSMGDGQGSFVSLSADGLTMAAGSASGPNGTLKGLVRVYTFDGSVWTQKGTDIIGNAEGDSFGTAISLSDDGNIIAISAPTKDLTASFAPNGQVQVYEWNGMSWVQKGSSINGIADFEALGESVSLSGSGSRLAVGVPGKDTNGVSADGQTGAVQVYEFGTDWTLLGAEIPGVEDFSSFGAAVSLDQSGTTLAVGASTYSGGGFSFGGQATVYRYNGTSWEAKGTTKSTFDGTAENRALGSSVSISNNGNRLALGEPTNLFGVTNMGSVQVWDYASENWTQVGTDIDSSLDGDSFGQRIELSGDGTHLIIGASGFIDPNNLNGRVQIWKLNSNDWEQVGDDITGEASQDAAGSSVAISSDGSIVASGAPVNGGGGAGAGQVRVYKFGVAEVNAAPVITPNQTFSIDENAANSTSVGMVIATDADAGTTFSNWTVTGGNEDGVFSLDPSTGEITVSNNSNLDFETSEQYFLSLTVSDGTDTSMPNTVTINVADVDEERPIVTISSLAETDPTNVNPITIVIGFDEPVTGFVKEDIIVSGGTTSNFSELGNLYSVDITPLANGAITVNIAANVAQDAAGNGNTAADQFDVTYDGTGPTVVVSSGEGSITNLEVIPITVTFSEEVSGFDLDDIDVGNGIKSNLLTNDNITFTVDISPSEDGTVTVDIMAATATDLAGNSNEAASQFSFISDRTPPEVEFLTFPECVNSDPFNVTFIFGADVTGFDVLDLSLTNASAGNLQSTLKEVLGIIVEEFTVDITPDGSGNSITMNIPANVAQDPAGNDNTASTTEVILYDAAAPVLSISSTATDPTNLENIPLTFAFNEPVSAFSSSQIIVTNGTLGDLVVDMEDQVFITTVSPDGEGEISVNVAANVVTDKAGNGNTAADQFIITYDGTSPTVIISSDEGDITNASLIPVTITFSEEVSGFTKEDITVGNGSAGDPLSSDDITFTVDITPTDDGTVTVDIAANVATDGVGNSNLEATQFSIFSDRTAPEIQFLEVPEYINTNNPFDITFIFGAEDAVGFEIADINLVNANASNLQSTLTTVFGVVVKQFTVDITPDGSQDNITISIPGGIAQDPAGNNNMASEVKEIIFDSRRPVPTISTTSADPTNLQSIPLTITFDEQVTGFTASAISVTNGSIGDLIENTANLVFTTTLSPASDGEVQVDIFANSASDNAGNGNAPGTFFILYDSSDPVPVITTDNELTNTSPIPITIDFSEEVMNFAGADLSLTGAIVSEITTEDNISFSVKLTPEPANIDSVQITIDIGAGQVNDLAGNSNTQAEGKSVIYDTKPPTPTLSTLNSLESDFGDFHSGSKFTAIVSLNEPVENFAVNDLTIAGGTISNFGVSILSPRLYTFEIMPAGIENITVTVSANAMNDQAGNQNAQGDVLEIVYDGVSPTLQSLTSQEQGVTNKETFELTVVLSEPVIPLIIQDLVVENGTVSSLSSTDNQTYLVEIRPSNDGEVTLNIAGTSIKDFAGNVSSEAVTFSITYDRSLPTLDIQNAPTAVNSTDPFTLTLQFSESITTLSESNIVVTNGTFTLGQTDTDTYSLEVTPGSSGDIMLTVSNYQDLAGNTGSDLEKTVVFDIVAPSVDIQDAPESITNKETFTITVAFSEEVTGFEAGDITVVNGSASNVTSGTDEGQFTVDIAPDAGIRGDDIITISIAADVAQDNAGNGNTASATVSVTFEQKYSGGSGTEVDPYLIGTEADLRLLSASFEDWASHFKQIANIKMSDDPFLPIGRTDDDISVLGINRPFRGSYDGDYHIISHLTLRQTVLNTDGGLFSSSGAGAGFIGNAENASLTHLGVVDVRVKASNFSLNSIGLVGVAYGNKVNLEEVFIHFAIDEISAFFFGGLVGATLAEKLTINNSYVTGEVNLLTTISSNEVFGSFVGLASSTSELEIFNSYSSLSAAGENQDLNKGGVLGLVLGTNSIISSINNTFWDKDLHEVTEAIGFGGTGNEGGTGLTSAEMRLLPTYTNAGWDFKGENANGSEDVWSYNFYYPLLSWQVDNLQPFTVSGQVVDNNGNVFTNGSIKAQALFAQPITAALDNEGKFSINLDKGLYNLSVVPNDPNAFFTTYKGNTNRFDRSRLVLHDESNIEIQMIAKTQQNQLNGNGVVTGRVVSGGAGNGRVVQGRLLTGDALEGVTVFLVRTSDQEILTSVETDANGDFEITGIPAGEYQLVLDVAGVDLNLEGSSFSVDEEGTPVVLSAVVGEEGIIFEFQEVLGIPDEIELLIFPNPVSKVVTIQTEGESSFKLFSQSGTVIREEAFYNKITLDVLQLREGIYLLEVVNNKGRSVRKLVKGF